MDHEPRQSTDTTDRAGLRTHLVALVLVAVVPALTAGILAVSQVVGMYRSAFEAGLQDKARGLASALDRQIGGQLAALTALAASPLLDENGDIAAFEVHARRAAEALGSPIIVVGPDLGQLLNTLRPAGTPLSPTNAVEVTREVFANRAPALGGFMRGATTGRSQIAVITPVIRNDRVIAAIGTRLTSARLSDLLSTQTLADGDIAVLTDSHGVVVARSRELDQHLGLPASTHAPSILNGRHAGLARGVAPEGYKVIYAFQQLAVATGWTVSVAQPLTAYDASWKQPLWALAISGVASLILALIWAVLLGRRILRPVDALTRQAEAVAIGRGRSLTPNTQTAPPSRVAEFEALRRAIARADTVLREQTLTMAASERRLRLLAEAGASAVWRAEPSGAIIESKGWEILTGQDADQLQGSGWLDVLHVDDIAPTMTAWMAAVAEKRPVDVEYRVRLRDGSYRRCRARGLPVIDEHGQLVEWVGVVEDIEARRRAEAQQALLMREVDHRARNLLAVVQSVLRLTRSDDPKEKAIVKTVEARVAALARAHGLLAEGGWAGADLRVIAEKELDAYGEFVLISGPSVMLVSTAVQPVAMVLHELSTNAAKYGALSTLNGKVEVNWKIDPEARVLRLLWSEQGGPVVLQAPVHRGFGTRLIDATIRSQLGGSITRTWPSRFVCEIVLPYEQIISPESAVIG